MQVSEAKQLFCEKGYSFDRLDDLFKKISSEVADGYLLANDGTINRYLFILGGELYSGAVVGSGVRKVTTVTEFFHWYKSKGSVDICLFQADKKLLLCMLVRLSHKPSQTFSTEVVNLEDVLKKIEGQAMDVVMALNLEKDWGFAIFIKGRAVYTFLQKQGGHEGSPLDRLLLYGYNLPEGKHVNAEIYTGTTVVPAEDSGHIPTEGVISVYGGGTVEEAGPYVEAFLEDGTSFGKFSLTDEITIGRESSCTITFDEAGVSRQHAVIRKLEDKVVMEDKESANGTFFNGVRIEHKDLNSGDELTIRKFKLRYVDPGSEELDADTEVPEKILDLKQDLASQTIYAEPLPDDVLEEITGEVQSGAHIVLPEGEQIYLLSITTIGKDDESDIKLDGMRVAKRHASIIRGKNMYKLIKKGGLSAVKVNGEKITEKVLRDGDEIELGGYKLIFKAG